MARLLIHNIEDFDEGLPFSVFLAPSGQRLSNRIQKGDRTLDIAGNDAISDAGERDLEQLTLGTHVLFRSLACVDAADHDGRSRNQDDACDQAGNHEGENCVTLTFLGLFHPLTE